MRKTHPPRWFLALALVVALLIVVILVNRWNNSTRCLDRPCSVSEILSRLDEAKSPMPVFVPRANSAYSAVIPTFYYVDAGDRYKVTTFFSTPQEPQTRIARMISSTLPGTFFGALNNSKTVTVSWADAPQGRTCEFTQGTYVGDTLPGTPYRTCVLWESQSIWFLFYSVLPLDDTLELINSLDKIR